METTIRYPVLQHCLMFCKEVRPQSFRGILDVGVQRGTVFLIEVFPGSHHYLFEPVVSYHDDIRRKYTSKNINFSFHGVGLDDVSTTLFLHELSSDGSGQITHSELSDKRHPDRKDLIRIAEIEGMRLDDVEFLPQLSPLEYMVKLDVDGIEERIIEGGVSVVRNASFVVLEASVVRDNVLTRLEIMRGLGFRLFDICDNGYYYNQLSCMDLVFINQDLRASEIRFRPWEYAKGKLNWEKWQHGYPKLAKEPLPKIFD